MKKSSNKLAKISIGSLFICVIAVVANIGQIKDSFFGASTALSNNAIYNTNNNFSDSNKLLQIVDASARAPIERFDGLIAYLLGRGRKFTYIFNVSINKSLNFELTGCQGMLKFDRGWMLMNLVISISSSGLLKSESKFNIGQGPKSVNVALGLSSHPFYIDLRRSSVRINCDQYGSDWKLIDASQFEKWLLANPQYGTKK